MTQEQTSAIKYYLVAVLDYVFAIAVFWDELHAILKIFAAIGVIVSTIYLIRKSRAQIELNRQRLKNEQMEGQIKEQELANLIRKNKNLQ